MAKDHGLAFTPVFVIDLSHANGYPRQVVYISCRRELFSPHSAFSRFDQKSADTFGLVSPRITQKACLILFENRVWEFRYHGPLRLSRQSNSRLLQACPIC